MSDVEVAVVMRFGLIELMSERHYLLCMLRRPFTALVWFAGLHASPFHSRQHNISPAVTCGHSLLIQCNLSFKIQDLAVFIQMEMPTKRLSVSRIFASSDFVDEVSAQFRHE